MVQVLSPGAMPAPDPGPPKEEEWHENLNVRVICRDCQEDPPNLTEDHTTGDLICDSCGLVLRERNIDMSSEWRNFGNDESGTDDPSRVGDGPNELLNGDQLSTGIAFGDGGMRTRELHRAQNRSTLDKANKQLLAAYKQIGALCDGWQLPGAVSDSAKHIYKDAIESPALKGKAQDVIIAGCIFIACRRSGASRSFREVMELTRVSKKEIGRIFKQVERVLRDKEAQRVGTTQLGPGGQVIGSNQSQAANAAPPSEMIPRYCNDLGMDQRATNVAVLLSDKIQALGALTGRSPLSAASACILMAGHMMDQSRTAKEIAIVTNVSDSTIRQAYKIMFNNKDKFIDEEILARGADPAKLPKPN